MKSQNNNLPLVNHEKYTSINRGENLDQKEKDNNDFILSDELLEASRNGDISTCESLLNQGADINYQNEVQLTIERCN